LKNALFLSATAAIMTDAKSKQYYDSKRAEGKNHKATLISLARKRVRIMFAFHEK